MEKDISETTSKEWLESFAAKRGIGYYTLLGAAEHYVATKEEFYLDNYYRATAKIPKEFWVHYANITGNEIVEEGHFFTNNDSQDEYYECRDC